MKQEKTFANDATDKGAYTTQQQKSKKLAEELKRHSPEKTHR